MSLPSGARLGPYQILAPLGQGGMGEVYRASDPRLGREVAIKILPASFSADPERLVRFEQEARAAAALNHPNILAVFDIGTHEGAPYVVSELLEGETLRERLQSVGSGGVSVRKATEYAIQIAHGLTAAHDKGIVHRDLKPENVFVTADGRVKILDFGLAKLVQPDVAVGPATNLPTTPGFDTQPGMVLGTIGYMSPEQVRGLPVDHRADLFAFGVILYEMLAGRRAFQGPTTADTMTAILKEDPADLPVAERQIPPALDRIVHRCLEKSPTLRFQTASDLAFALEALSSHTDKREVVDAAVVAAAPVLRSHERLAWAAAAVLLISTAVLAGVVYFRPREEARVQKLSMLPPEKTVSAGGVGSGFALSPDGQSVAFARIAEGKQMLWVRRLDGVSAKPLAGTDGAASLFWSPDSRSIGFFAQGKLKRIPASGGAAQVLCDAANGRGGTWSTDGVILFVPDQLESVYRVSASGGSPTPVTTIDAASEVAHGSPVFLPDGRHFLYSAAGTDIANGWIRVGTLGSSDTRPLVQVDSNAAFAHTAAGDYLLFARDGILQAQPLDAGTVVVTGEPVTLVDELVSQQVLIATSSRFYAFSVSGGGMLIYRADAGQEQRQIMWVDRTGKAIESLGAAGAYGHVELSPNGRQAALDRLDPQSQRSDIYLLDMPGDTPRRFTFEPGRFLYPHWSSSGDRLLFTADAGTGGRPGFYQKPVAGSGTEDRIYESTDNARVFANDWSPGEQFVAFRKLAPGTPGDLWILPLSGDRQPKPVPQADVRGGNGRFSRDGRWLAYQSEEGGRPEVWVQPFPALGPKWQVSRAGGVRPRWRRDGKELFYTAPGGTLMAVSVAGGPTFQAGPPAPLSTSDISPVRSTPTRTTCRPTASGSSSSHRVTTCASLRSPLS